MQVSETFFAAKAETKISYIERSLIYYLLSLIKRKYKPYVDLPYHID